MRTGKGKMKNAIKTVFLFDLFLFLFLFSLRTGSHARSGKKRKSASEATRRFSFPPPLHLAVTVVMQ